MLFSPTEQACSSLATLGKEKTGIPLTVLKIRPGFQVKPDSKQRLEWMFVCIEV